jgi:hypothetical protein
MHNVDAIQTTIQDFVLDISPLTDKLESPATQRTSKYGREGSNIEYLNRYGAPDGTSAHCRKGCTCREERQQVWFASRDQGAPSNADCWSTDSYLLKACHKVLQVQSGFPRHAVFHTP